ncbi:MAG: ABC transporter permease [Chloroherpetonaceae bacterium]
MLKHIFKLVWNRRKENMLTAIQICAAFLVMALLFTQSVQYLRNYLKPLGFEYKNVWTVNIDTKTSRFDWNRENAEKLERLYREIKAFQEVESVAGSYTLPFLQWNWTSGDSAIGKFIIVEREFVTDDYAETMKLNLTQGRWFEKSDDALGYTPAVINERLAKAYFGDESPIGKRIFPRFPRGDDKSSGDPTENRREARREERVVGVVSDFRKFGELSNPLYFAFRRTAESDSLMSSPPRCVLIKVTHAGMVAAFEEKLVKRLEQLTPEWSFRIASLEKMRETYLKETLTPLISFAVIGGFLIVMVALGLVGVVWQNVTRRTREIGLRRAIGSTATVIYAQVLGELLAITTFAVIFGALIFIQIPLLNLTEVVGWSLVIQLENYLIGLGAAVGAVYVIAGLCALYPSTMATRVAPVQALRYE